VDVKFYVQEGDTVLPATQVSQTFQRVDFATIDRNLGYVVNFLFCIMLCLLLCLFLVF